MSFSRAGFASFAFADANPDDAASRRARSARHAGEFFGANRRNVALLRRHFARVGY